MSSIHSLIGGEGSRCQTGKLRGTIGVIGDVSIIIDGRQLARLGQDRHAIVFFIPSPKTQILPLFDGSEFFAHAAITILVNPGNRCLAILEIGDIHIGFPARVTIGKCLIIDRIDQCGTG